MAMNSEIDETQLTLKDAAHLLCRTDQLPLETQGRLAAVIRTDPRFTGHVEKLEALARDAGTDMALDDWPTAAF